MSVVDRGFDRLLERMKQLAGEIARVEIGVIDAADPETAKIAAIHEHGAPSVGIPQRSFLRGTIYREKAKIVALQREALGRVADGDWTIKQALNAIGEEIASDVKREIQKGIAPPLKPATVRAKKRKGYTAPSIPLRATDALLNAIKHRVVNE